MKTKLLTICLLLPITLSGCSSNSCDDSKSTSQWHNCSGTEVRKGIDIYVGEFKKGKANGQGIMTTLTGFKREGEFKDGKQHGYGTLEKANGNIYTGEFLYNFKHGKGTEVYSNGSKYTGEWKAGHRSGHGTLIYKSGNKYVGKFLDSMLHGPGIKTIYDEKDKDQWEMIITGNWKRNKLDGFITTKYKSDKQYLLDPIICSFHKNGKQYKEGTMYISSDDICDQNTARKFHYDLYSKTLGYTYFDKLEYAVCIDEVSAAHEARGFHKSNKSRSIKVR